MKWLAVVIAIVAAILVVFWSIRDGSEQEALVADQCLAEWTIPAPVDLAGVSGVLYPGQYRGDDFKAHGGFRFDNLGHNAVLVHAVLDGEIFKASRYMDEGEVQHLIFYRNDCGIMVMHDHLLTLSPKISQMYANIPIGGEDDSRTTMIEPPLAISKGEALATEIGYKLRSNVFLDFGLYDMTWDNGSPIPGEYAKHGLCFIDYFDRDTAQQVRSMPAGGHEGKVSDYCE